MIDTWKTFDFPFDTTIEPLFSKNIERRFAEIRSEVEQTARAVSGDVIEQTSRQSVIDRIVEKGTIGPLTVDLNRSSIKKRYFIDANSFAFMFYIPFQGNAELFDYKLGQKTRNKDLGASRLHPSYLLCPVATSELDADYVNKRVDEFVEEIRDHTEATRKPVEEFNKSLVAFVTDIIDANIAHYEKINRFIDAVQYEDFDLSEVETLRA